MASPSTPDSRSPWASAGAGLLVGLLVVVLVFSLTSPSDDNPIKANEPTAAAPTTVDKSGPGPATTSTTVVVSTTTIAPSDPTVTITRSIGPCKYGESCLIASFTISDFAEPPSEFVCIFHDDSRFTFRFEGDGAENACNTATKPSSITIEVDGVLSETITNP